MSLLEVLLSSVVLGVAITGFLMALSTAATTSTIARNESELVYLASLEFETLQGASFEDLPFFQTDVPGNIQEVPDYFKDIAISEENGGNTVVGASGDLQTAYDTYSRYAAFDGKRANFNQDATPTRWMGDKNLLAWDENSGGPIINDPFGGGGDPNIGDPGGGDPNGGDTGFAPDDFQYLFCAFPELTTISRILYDNRFNVSEKMGVPTDHMDYLPHLDDTWQRNFEFFFSDRVLNYGDIYDPWKHENTPILFTKDLGYGSSDIQVIFDNAVEPLKAGIIGVEGIDTYTDFDPAFHYPYVSEIEVYGFNNATNYVGFWETRSGEMQFDNVIMYFPNYLDSGFDLARRTYIDADSLDASIRQRKNLVHVEIEFYSATSETRNSQWQRLTWWQSDDSELAKFSTSFYRDEPTRVDRLPNLKDKPEHEVYDNDEDLLFPYTVPGASEIRGQFGDFDLEPGPGTDYITVEDGDGNVYMGPLDGSTGLNAWTPWIPGDTIVIHFISNNANNTYDSGYRGFSLDRVEVKWVGTGGSTP
ncbi:MAG: hypothetical protein NTY09_09000 [bacterium]|nr:hypothetical protein [bacterium]